MLTFCGILWGLSYITHTLIHIVSPHSSVECAKKLARGSAGGFIGGMGLSRVLGNGDAGFECRCKIPQVYETGKNPRLTAIVQSFNHRANIANISGSLKKSSVVEEIVICEDGSTDGSVSEWHEALPGDNHFIIRSNNLHELRSYNRAMRLSSGDVVVLLQDDDLLPYDDAWLKNAISLFEMYPNLGLLGGYIGQTWNPDTGKGKEFGEQISTHGGVRAGNTERIRFLEPTLNIPFMFVECVWIAPVFARRELLQKAGGLDLDIAKRGEPGVWQDCVFSYETWINGFTVGVFDSPFVRGVGGHGSASSPEKLKMRARVWERAVAYSNRRYARRRIHEYVEDLNNSTLTPRKAMREFAELTDKEEDAPLGGNA